VAYRAPLATQELCERMSVIRRDIEMRAGSPADNRVMSDCSFETIMVSAD
jgi:hypothetical protein